jgi:hypothetical protein
MVMAPMALPRVRETAVAKDIADACAIIAA